MGRLIGTSTAYSFLPGQNYTNNYTYDAASNRTVFTAPDGNTNTYGYDNLNRLTSLTNSLTGQFGFGYDALSRRTSLTRPNGVNTSYSYDSLSRLLSVLHQSGATTIDGASYTLDNAGNRTTKVNQLNGITENYTYDPVYQLTQVQQTINGVQNTTESYSYDAEGNRLSSLNVSSYTYNNSNELTSSSAGYSYTYDANGNTLTKTSASGTTQYTWDFEDRLTNVTLPNGNGTVSIKYDSFGRRVQKMGSNGTTNYLYDGDNLLRELDQGGNALTDYTQTQRLDEPLAMSRSGAIVYYESDGLWSVTSLSDGNGLVDTYTYDSFGGVARSTGTLVNPFQYTGREFDGDLNLQFSRHRYYDSLVGRFTSEDAIRFEEKNPNPYRYVRNHPTKLIDPLGMQVGSPDCPTCVEVAEGAYWMWLGYERMKQKNWRGSDKYYHCMANCLATDSGFGGELAAKVISFFRTDVSSRFREPNDWKNDDKANKCGQQGGDCKKTCAPWVPPSSPGNPPFPGWNMQ